MFGMSRTTVRLPDELLLQAQAQAQAHAMRTGRTFTQLLADALRYEIQRAPEMRRVCEPLPTYGVMGCRPGETSGPWVSWPS